MIVCAVLAAGASRRLGAPKQLIEWRGKPLVVHAVEAARAVGVVGVVVGAARDDVERALGQAARGGDARDDVERALGQAARGGASPLSCLVNEAWEEGMASSVRVAARWARGLEAEALVLHLVDQPRIDGAHLARLVAEHRAGAALVGTSYADVIGAPALLSRAYFDALEALTGDRGAAPILRAHAETRAIAGPDGALDIDTKADVDALRARD